MTPASPSSLRDPSGRLIFWNGRHIRLVEEAAAPVIQSFLGSGTAAALVRSGQLIPTWALADSEVAAVPGGKEAALVLEHERVWFPSYPHEWPPEMLQEAGAMTLHIAEQALSEGYGLKDATPFNVLFRGPRPTFVDWLSFERHEPGEYLWMPEGQFTRTFVLPLLVNARFGIPLSQIFASHRDGIEPEVAYRLCGPLRRLLPPFLSVATLPTWLAGQAEARGQALYKRQRLENVDKASFILRRTLSRLRRRLAGAVRGARTDSAWAGYMQPRPDHYSAKAFEQKQAFVREAMESLRPRRVLDIGCNTGLFSELCARAGASVVAVDADPVVVGHLWKHATSEGLDILPLVVDLARPSPALGWRNREWPSFLSRASGAVDTVLLLGVLHHLVVTEGIPLEEVVQAIAELTSDVAIIEFVEPRDPLFRQLTRGREALHAGLTREFFEHTCRSHFSIERAESLEATQRTLFLLRRK